MQPRLHGELEDEQHAKDFVADALLGGFDASAEEVAQVEEALREVVVGAGEVEDAEKESVQGRRGGDGVDVGEDDTLYGRPDPLTIHGSSLPSLKQVPYISST